MRMPVFGATGPDVLAHAAHVLPLVSGRLPYSGDVHTALFEALTQLDVGTDRYHRLWLADEAWGMFAAHLVVSGQAAPESLTSDIIRSWVIEQDPDGLRWALVEAACFWRRELDLPVARRGDR
ncbi:MAG: hypothetical protein ACRDT2_02635 [Natronosporangium sp.]